MTIIQAITMADERLPNVESMEQKLYWLGNCEASIYREIIHTHDGGEGYPMPEISTATDTGLELIMPKPYDEAYVHYLMAQISYNADEITKYNNAIGMAEGLIDEFATSWKRDHMPKGLRRFRF